MSGACHVTLAYSALELGSEPRAAIIVYSMST